MALWHIMFGLGIGVFLSVGVTLMSMMATQPVHAVGRPKRITYCSTPEDRCPICLENMTNADMHYLKCGHAIHDACYTVFRRQGDNKCPTCREKV